MWMLHPLTRLPCDFSVLGRWMGCTESVSLHWRTSPAALSSPMTTTSIPSTQKSRWSIFDLLIALDIFHVQSYLRSCFYFGKTIFIFISLHCFSLHFLFLYSKCVSAAQRAAEASSEGRASVLTACLRRREGLDGWVDSRRRGSPNTSSRNEWVMNVHKNTCFGISPFVLKLR